MGGGRAGVVVIDEVQRAPGLLTVVQELIEPTDSSARKLRRTAMELPGGCADPITMHPFLAAALPPCDGFPRRIVPGRDLVP